MPILVLVYYSFPVLEIIIDYQYLIPRRPTQIINLKYIGLGFSIIAEKDL